MVNFSNLDSVVSQIIMDYIRKVFGFAEESENFPVIVEELFLRCYFATSKRLLHKLFHVVVTRTSNLFGWFLEGIWGDWLGVGLGLSDILNKVRFQIGVWFKLRLGAYYTCPLQVCLNFTYSEEISSVGIAVINADLSAKNANVKTNAEVIRHEGAHSVTLEDHLTLEESSLRDARILLFGLGDHNWLILQEIVDVEKVNSEVFETALNYTFFEVAEEAEDLNHNQKKPC